MIRPAPPPSALDLTDTEVADALWLALHLGLDPAARDSPEPVKPPPGREDGPVTPGSSRKTPEPPPATAKPPGPPVPTPTLLLVDDRGTDDARLHGWPAVPALAGAAAIARELRPLRRLVPSRHDRVPDEDATAERAVESGRWLPVYHAAEERRWDLMVVVDDSPTMRVWQKTVGAFTTLMQHLGAFRNIGVRLIDTSPSEPDGVSVRGTGAAALPRPPSSLHDPTGRRLFVVLSDGLAPGWRTDAVLATLGRWATRCPVAVVNLLPQQFWHRSAVPAHRLTLLAGTVGLPSARTPWRSRETAGRVIDPYSTAESGVGAIPVLELGRRWLRGWTTLVAGERGEWVNSTAAVLPGWPGGPLQRADPPTGDSEEPLTAEARVTRFRATASPTAVRLAIHLAAAPLNLPVARLVQAVMLPDSRTSHLAEVVNSPLLLRPVADPAAPAVDRVTMEFEDGVRAALLSLGRRDDTMRVMRVVDQYLGPLVDSVSGLSRLVDEPESPVARVIDSRTAPFVRVEAAVLCALSGPHLPRHRTLSAALGFGNPVVEVPMTTTPARPPQTSDVDTPVPPGPQHGPQHARREQPAPTATPTVWGSVPPRNPNFTGRVELLETLHERLNTGTTAVLPEALHGMGGVGKSQLAVEYVYRHQSDYDLIWWIPAERPAQIGQALSELAQRLKLPVSAELNAAVPAVREALRVGVPHRNWLLVFDNAESPDAVRPYFPSGGPGCILVTSRDARWGAIARTLEVTVFTRQESTELLNRRGPELSADDADRLADVLGDLPLAIEQAAAWRAETGMPAEEYLRLLEEKRPELLNDAPPLDYPTTVAAAWNVSLDALRERNIGALRLLQLCAFLAPEPLPRTLLTSSRGTQINPDLDATLRDPIEFGRAIREINRYALAKMDHRNQSIQMHRLVQRVLVGQMTDEERESMAHGAHLLLAAADPNQPDNTSHWSRYGELYSHVIASGAVGCNDPWVRKLVYNEAQYLWRWGDSPASLDLSQHVYDEWRRELGAEDPETLKMASWLGFMLFVAGHYERAAELNAVTLETYRRTLGEEHEATLEAMQAVAADRRVQGEFGTALEISETVHSRSVQMFGPDDPITLRAAHNLAVSLRLTSEFDRAEALDTDTAQRYVQVLGEDHPDSLLTRLGLIIDQRELGDYSGARQALEDLVARHKLLFGDDNFFTLRAVRTLSVTLRKAGDHEGALEQSTEARTRFVETHGEDHPETMAATLDLSTDRRQNGDLRGARDLGMLILQRYRQTFGEEHPHTVGAAINLATTHRLMGDVESAYEVDRDGLERLRARLGDEHVQTMSCAINLASDMFARGEVGNAYDVDLRTNERLRVRLGEDHPITLASSINLAIDLRAMDRTEEAMALHSETVDRFRRALGPDHPATVEAARWVRANCDMYPMPL